MNGFEKEAAAIGGRLKAFFREVAQDVEPALKKAGEEALDSFEQKITPEAIQLMGDAVDYAGTIGGGDDTLRATALEKFATDSKSTANSVAIFAKNEANALLEFVYIFVKGKAEAVAAKAASENEPPTSTETINSPGVSL